MRVPVEPEKVLQVFKQYMHEPGFEESKSIVEQGELPVEMLQAMSLRPEILKAFAGFGNCLYPGGLLERALKEKVILKSSLRNSCQFCINSHYEIMRMAGIPQQQIYHLEDPKNLTERERVALAYTEAVMRDSNRVSDQLFTEVKKHFSPPEIVQLTMLIGYINMLNWFNNALQVEYKGDYGK
ncbi:carboxymuconolactone decarboxylase family protein [Candidatus Acetothermia bacterium]|nr:carboxymuconolactone decarboxylase family protein [Candidatus Acetothermia bacterium]